MSSIFGPLGIGRSALLAQQRALAVTGSNVANANTPGYSRQRAILSPVPLASGGGVVVSSVEQIVDRLLDARQLRGFSSRGAATTTSDFADRVESLLPVNGPSIGTALDEFFASASELSTHPSDLAVRSDFLARADALATRIRGAARGLAELQREADERIGVNGVGLNPVLSQLAILNRSIAAARVSGGGENELLDQRRQALLQLAEQLEVRTVEHDDGTLDVFTASGAPLVVGDSASEIAVEATAALGIDGAPLHRLGIRDAGGGVIPLYGELGGALGALGDLRDTTLPGDVAALDSLADTIRDAVNGVQTDPAGRDLDGLVGSALFSGSGASDFAIALTDPRGIAAARSAAPGDNANALALVDLRTTSFASLSGAKLGEYHSSLLARVGSRAREAADRATVEDNLAASVAAERESVSGVSLEEEFTDLIRFQRGFEAAGQLIAVSNHMLDEIMQLVR